MIDYVKFRSRLMVTGELELKSVLHVGAGKSSSPVDPDMPVVKDVFGRPVIPGSSLKGALRSHVEGLIRGVDAQHACDADYEKKVRTACVTKDDVRDWRKETPALLDQKILSQLCLVCRTFGSPWMASKVRIMEASVIEDTWPGIYLVRDGVAIDRDKGTVADKAKYDYEVVPASTRFNFRMQVDNASPEELGLAMLAVRTLQEEQVLLGGSHRAGAGWCKLHVTGFQEYGSAQSIILNKPVGGIDAAIGDDIKKLLDYLGVPDA